MTVKISTKDSRMSSNDIIRMIPLLTAGTKVLESDGKTISICHIEDGTRLQTNEGLAYVLKVIRIPYEGPIHVFLENSMTGYTPFMTESGYVDRIKTHGNSTRMYKGYLYNLILSNNGLIKLAPLNGNNSIYVGSCGFKYTNKYFEESLFYGTQVSDFLISNYNNFVITLEHRYFSYNEESCRIEIDFETIIKDNYIYKFIPKIFWVGVMKRMLFERPMNGPLKIQPIEDDKSNYLEEGLYWEYHDLSFIS